VDDCCSKKGETLIVLAQGDQRRVLVIVMIVNIAMFVAEFGAGVVAQSSALMADSVDMMGDAFVYALSLYALSRGTRWQAGAALTKGLIILAFGLGILIEIAFKISNGVTPSSRIMMIFSAIALVANGFCLALLWRFRKLNVNMRSTFECSRNDVASNIGVLAAGALVALSGSFWPDIIIAAIIAALFLRSAFSVLASAWPVFHSNAPQQPHE
jgi:Co/Zn/Cd efflux system component